MFIDIFEVHTVCRIRKSQNVFKPEKNFLVSQQLNNQFIFLYFRSSSHLSKLTHYWHFCFWKASISFPKWTWKAFWSDLPILACCLSATERSKLTLLRLLLIPVHVLVSLGKEERKVKNKNRRKMKPWNSMREMVVSQNIMPLTIKYYASRKSMQW